MKKFIVFSLWSILISCGANSQIEKKAVPEKSSEKLSAFSKAYFAAGCFWCVEAVFESVEGVEEAVSGYSGGSIEDPDYELVCTGTSGHAETVEVYYDSTKISYETLLKVFFDSHDPSTLNQQGPDRGTQYRSAIFYQNETERKLAEAYIRELESKGLFSTITTEVSPLTVFYKAESYHQNYERNHPESAYIQSVSIPRINAFKEKNKQLLKANH